MLEKPNADIRSGGPPHNNFDEHENVNPSGRFNSLLFPRCNFPKN